MRITNLRLAVLICALGAMSEALFYTALAPLLTALDDQFGFHQGQAGLLVAGYAIGYWIGTYPAYRLSARFGPRAAAVVGVACVATATLGFALGATFALLMVARILVGLGSVIAYTGLLSAVGAIAGPQQRGMAIGTVYSGSAAGSAVGPLVGSLAVEFGRGPVFAMVAAGQAVVAGLLTRLPTVPNTDRVSMRVMGSYLTSSRVRTGLWITSVPGFALGVLTLSGTYRLDELGAGSTLIAVAFSGIAVINVFVAPRIGKASDRLGRRTPLMLSLAVAGITVLLIAAVSLEISTVVLIAIAGAFMLAVAGPGLALVGDGIHGAGGDPAHATFLMNAFWGPAAALGAISAGIFHSAGSDALSLLVLTTIIVISLLLTRRLR
ncbi:MAG: MFS transporter [Gaiellales bacterium]|jgi:MFS family permease|nr:MFS transporter [Gaiellales bacterium]